MAASHHLDDYPVHIGVEEFMRRFEAAEPLTVLDARNREPWEASPVKIPGALRWTGQIDPSWPQGRLMVVY